MKNLIWTCFITFLIFQPSAYAQNIHLSTDSVTMLLCKKWEIDYALVEGEKIDMPPSTPKAYFQFYKNRTFSFTGGEPGRIEKGIWEYEASKGIIFISIGGKDRKQIVSLTRS